MMLSERRQGSKTRLYNLLGPICHRGRHRMRSSGDHRRVSVGRQAESECQQGESDDNGFDEVNSTRARVTSMAEGVVASVVPPLETPCGDRPAPDALTIPATRLEKRAEAMDYSMGKAFAQSTASHDDARTSSHITTEAAADHSRGKSPARSTASSVDSQVHRLAGSVSTYFTRPKSFHAGRFKIGSTQMLLGAGPAAAGAASRRA